MLKVSQILLGRRSRFRLASVFLVTCLHCSLNTPVLSGTKICSSLALLLPFSWNQAFLHRVLVPFSGEECIRKQDLGVLTVLSVIEYCWSQVLSIDSEGKCKHVCICKGLPASVVNNPLAGQETQEVEWFDPWKIPWRGKCQPTPVFLAENPCGQRSLVGHSSQAPKSQTRLSTSGSVCEYHCAHPFLSLSVSVENWAHSDDSSSSQHHSVLSGFLSVFVLPFSDREKPARDSWLSACVTNHSPVATTASSTPWVASCPTGAPAPCLEPVLRTVPSLLSQAC